jgi:hypothetical protein
MSVVPVLIVPKKVSALFSRSHQKMGEWLQIGNVIWQF